MKIIRLLTIALIIFCEGYFFFLLQGKHEPIYYLQVANARKAEIFFVIGILLTCIHCYADKFERVVVVLGMVFCFITSLLQAYTFIPPEYPFDYKFILVKYYYLWSCIAVCMAVYILAMPIIKKLIKYLHEN